MTFPIYVTGYFLQHPIKNIYQFKKLNYQFKNIMFNLTII